MLPILHHKMELYGIYRASYFLKRRLSLKTLLNVRQAKTEYGLNEKVIASVVSKLRKGYSTEDMMFIYLSIFFFTFQ